MDSSSQTKASSEASSTSVIVPGGDEHSQLVVESVWHNFLVNLTPKEKYRDSDDLMTTPGTTGHSPSSDSANKLVIDRKQGTTVHFALSGDFDQSGDSKDDTDECDDRWYQFDENDLIEPKSSALLSAGNTTSEHTHDHGIDAKQSLFKVYTQNAVKMCTENRFRKSWGNFINIFDEHGRQKNCIDRAELSNYLVMSPPKDTPDGHKLKFIVTLFTGNYPKPLFRSTWSWRMRWNVFVAGLSEEVLSAVHMCSGVTHEENNNDEEDANQRELEKLGLVPPRPRMRYSAPIRTEMVEKPKSYADKLLHLGEMHIYFHVERGRDWPVYQNLCFFFDPSLMEMNKKLSLESSVKEELEAAAIQLKCQLAVPEFVSQLYFPVHKDRFDAVDQTVEYFVLRQKDLQAAIAIANQEVPFSFLHRAPSLSQFGSRPPSGNKAATNSRSSRCWSSSSSGLSLSSASQSALGSPQSGLCRAKSLSSGASSAQSWRRRNSLQD